MLRATTESSRTESGEGRPVLRASEVAPGKTWATFFWNRPSVRLLEAAKSVQRACYTDVSRLCPVLRRVRPHGAASHTLRAPKTAQCCISQASGCVIPSYAV